MLNSLPGWYLDAGQLELCPTFVFLYYPMRSRSIRFWCFIYSPQFLCCTVTIVHSIPLWLASILLKWECNRKIYSLLNGRLEINREKRDQSKIRKTIIVLIYRKLKQEIFNIIISFLLLLVTPERKPYFRSDKGMTLYVGRNQ